MRPSCTRSTGARDGNSFSTRRIVAIQDGAQIFNMSASFQVVEEGHRASADPCRKCRRRRILHEQAWHFRDVMDQVPPALRRMLELKRPFEFRPGAAAELSDARGGRAGPRRVVSGHRARLPDDEPLHRCLLAYVSDYELLGTALVPHGKLADLQHLMIASIDHAMWFHRDVRVDEWLLYSTDSPSASGARGFARGCIFARATAAWSRVPAREGLLRVRRPQ